MSSRRICEGWLPESNRAAICFTIDDVHPGKSSDAYEAGGDLHDGALGHVAWLLDRHPKLKVTLFVTPDWREISPTPSETSPNGIESVSLPGVLAPVLPEGTMRLDRHPEFVNYLDAMPRTDIGVHGLHHIHSGPKLTVEYQDETSEDCFQSVSKSLSIFHDAGIDPTRGMTPPGWNAPPALIAAMDRLDFKYLASARDIVTPISPEAETNMSGLTGVSLIYPQIVGKSLVHLTNNFQATSPIERATEIIEHGGIVAIKAHIVKNAMGHITVDGIDRLYCNYLDVLFRILENEYRDSLWWCSMGELASRIQR